jgi:hypothetical protein
MPGNKTKAQALDWLAKYGKSSRGYPQEIAAAYIGLGVKSFRDGVAKGLLPKPQQHGKRLVWDKGALDKFMDDAAKSGDAAASEHDPIMADIHASQSSPLRPGRQS